MKYPPLKNLVVSLATCLAGPLSAQTTFNGGDLGNAGNWTNGLPTSVSNPGSIAVNGTLIANPATTYTDYYITQTAGVIGFSGSGNDPRLSGGTFEQNGGTWGVASGGRGFRQENSNVTTLTSGKIISGTNGGTQINNGSTLIVNGGSLETYGIQRGILLSAAGTLTINGGSVFTDTTGLATNIFGIGRLATGNNFINLNGGTTTVKFLGFGRNNSNSQLTLTLGGTTAGSFTAENFVALSADELITERDINWLPGTLMTVKITNADEWAAAEWDTDRLSYNGQSKTDLGGLTWADATNSSIGLGGGKYFVYDSVTETLSLGSGTPPSAPEIEVNQGGDIASGGSKDFGTVTIGSNTSLVFTINNTGSAALNLTGTSPDYVVVGGANPGDFIVTAQPSNSVAASNNTNFTVQFAPGGSGLRNATLSIANNDTTGSEDPFVINVSGTGQTPYEAWAGGAAFDADANDDGVDNGLAFLLGADTPTSAVTLPTVSHSSGNLVLTFSMRNSANRGSASLIVQHSSDLGIGDAWSVGATVPTDGDGVTFNVTPGSPLDSVTAEISSDEAASGRLFGRLKAQP